MKLSMSQIRALVGVADCGSIRAAAQRMQMTQAAVTQAMGQLEKTTSTSLLIRSSNGVRLTEAGERLLLRARVIISQMQMAEEELMPFQADRRIRVAVTPHVPFTLVAEAMRRVRMRFPKTDFTLIDGRDINAIPKLRAGALDMAYVVRVDRLPPSDFLHRDLVKIPLTIAVRKGHPLLDRETVTTEDLLEMEWLAAATRFGEPTQPFCDFFARAGLPMPKRISYCDNMLSVRWILCSDAAALLTRAITIECGFDKELRELRVPGVEAGALDLMCLTSPLSPLSSAEEYFSHCLEDELMQIVPLGLAVTLE